MIWQKRNVTENLDYTAFSNMKSARDIYSNNTPYTITFEEFCFTSDILQAMCYILMLPFSIVTWKKYILSYAVAAHREI